MRKFILSVLLATRAIAAPIDSGPIHTSAKYGHTGEEVGEVIVNAHVNEHGDITVRTMIVCTKEPTNREMIEIEADIELIVSNKQGSKIWGWWIPHYELEGKGTFERYWSFPNALNDHLLQRAANIYPNCRLHVHMIGRPPTRFRSTCEGCKPTSIDISAVGSLVVILPGITGARNDSDLQNIKRWIEKENLGDGAAAVRIWDWTADPRCPNLFPLQGRIEIRENLQAIANDLANHLVRWDKKAGNKEKRITLVGLSGGATMAALVCHSKTADKKNHVLSKDFFDKVIFLSGALDTRTRDLLKDTDHASKGVYNYLSYHDTVLTASSFIEFMFFIPIPTGGHVRWTAIGRFGLADNDPNFKHITSQLCWLDKSLDGGLELGNYGGHLNSGCLSEGYFKRFILPLFHEDINRIPAPSPVTQEGWSPSLHRIYRQDQSETDKRNSEADPVLVELLGELD